MIMEVTVEDEIAGAEKVRPHVVILGAGASRAACPSGDRHGRILPLMADFSKLVGVGDLLASWGLNPEANIEDSYSLLHFSGQQDRLEQLNEIIFDYFDGLELPAKPNIYDHLILSLREKDVVATFNWDPFLIQACLRNSSSGLSVPRLAFLHGNVLSGFCAEHMTYGVRGNMCSRCAAPLAATPLLYPVNEKNYSGDRSIGAQWELLRAHLAEASMITVFGYGAPKSDVEAMSLMSEGWGHPHERTMEQNEFITRDTELTVKKSWDRFIYSHHYEIHDDFYDSWIAKHPRRTVEAFRQQFLEAKFIADNPIPRELDFPGLWDWYSRFKAPERDLQLRS